jgi:hydrogenase expression/formation protein HypE
VLDVPPGHRLVMATDGHVISPLFFPGGDIGCLSVHGTVNDVAMMGATPTALSASFILEEGFRWRTSSASSNRWPPPRARPACPS